MADVMRHRLVSVDGRTPLDQAFDRLQDRLDTPAVVIERGRLIGVLDLETLDNFVRVRSALQRGRGDRTEGPFVHSSKAPSPR